MRDDFSLPPPLPENHPFTHTSLTLQATWAALVYHGETGYTDACKKVVDTARKIAEGAIRVDFFVWS